jgi:hypothetical protein
MKTALKLLFLAACLGLWVACDKSAEDLSVNDLKKATPACPEIVVEPEDGFDTENLLAAFEEAKIMGSGTFAEGAQLTGNNFTGATFADAIVYLGPVSRNNMVAGVSSDVVVDEGINNKIIGTKAQKQGVPPLRPLFKNTKPLK